MHRLMLAGMLCVALGAAVTPGCSGPSGVRGHPGEAEEGGGEHGMRHEVLVPRQFIRGGEAGLARARAENRGAMLLFVASW